MARLEFWYDFASTYSYLSALRIDGLAAAARVDVAWRPFLLGPIFKAQGWDTSPFNIYPAKGRYMVRDIGRIAAARKIPFVMPDVFPAHTLAAARLALVDLGPDWTKRFSRAVFEAQFSAGGDIGNPELLSHLIQRIDERLDPALVLRASRSDDAKERLRRQTQVAVERGIFGAPSFVCGDGELFWGDDRLADALRWSSTVVSE